MTEIIQILQSGVLGWIGTIMIMTGSILIGKKCKLGWVLNVIASCLFVIDLWVAGTMLHMIPFNIFMFILGLWNYHKWARQEIVDAYLNAPPL
jgi:hypothetical protein